MKKLLRRISMIGASCLCVNACSAEEVTGDIPALTRGQEVDLVKKAGNGDGVAAERLFLFYLDVRRYGDAEQLSGNVASYDLCKAAGMLSELRDTYRHQLNKESLDIVVRGYDCSDP